MDDVSVSAIADIFFAGVIESLMFDDKAVFEGSVVSFDDGFFNFGVDEGMSGSVQFIIFNNDAVVEMVGLTVEGNLFSTVLFDGAINGLFSDGTVNSGFTFLFDFSTGSTYTPGGGILFSALGSSVCGEERVLDLIVFESNAIELLGLEVEFRFKIRELETESINFDLVSLFVKINLVFIVFGLLEDFLILLVFDVNDLGLQIFGLFK